MISLEWVKDYIDISDQDLNELARKITESGINIARKIREKDIESIIIFLTSHYELGSVLLEDEIMFLTFISKFNNMEDRIVSALNKSLKLLGKKQAIRFEDHGVLYTIPIDDILYITHDSVSRKSIIKTDYTEFYILDDNNNTTNIPTNVTQNSIHKIVVGITNQEHQDMNYTVKISKDDIILTKYNQSLQDKENREIPYYMTSTHNKGQNQLIKFELFKNNDTSPYRTLNLRYNVI